MTIDGPNNVDAFARLVGSLVTGHAIAFVGAGYSRRALSQHGEPGFPTWGELLDLLHESVEKVQPGGARGLDSIEDSLWRAEEYRRLLGDEYPRLIREVFEPSDSQLTDFHKTVVLMPFRHFLTTNYDLVLEEAIQQALLTKDRVRNVTETSTYLSVTRSITWNDRASLAEFFRRVYDSSYASRIVHVHGRYDQPESIVLTERDYTKRYIEGPKTYEMLWALGVTHPFVFIGFSASDLDVMAFFRAVRAVLGPTGPEHFVLYGLHSEQDGAAWRRMLRGKYGLTPVYYEVVEVNGNIDHSAVETLVSEIYQAYRDAMKRKGIE